MASLFGPLLVRGAISGRAVGRGPPRSARRASRRRPRGALYRRWRQYLIGNYLCLPEKVASGGARREGWQEGTRGAHVAASVRDAVSGPAAWPVSGRAAWPEPGTRILHDHGLAVTQTP